MLPIGVRGRQLRVRTLLAGMCLTQHDGRPAHLTRVHQALTGLPEDEQHRLGVIADWHGTPHRLTYRQTERTFALIAAALGKDDPDGLPSQGLQRTCDDLLEASVPEQYKDASASLAVDWTDVESFSRPPPPAARRQPRRLRRPRSILGAPHRQPARPRRRDVLRLLRLGCHHDPRREQPAHPRTGPPVHPVLLPARPGPRLHPRPDRHARRRDHARRRARRLRLRPPRPGRLGHPHPRRRRQPDPGPASPRPRPERDLPRRHHQQRQPVLPRRPPARCWNWDRCLPAPPPKTPPRTTRRPPNWPGTSPAASPATTPTDTTGSCAPPPWARSAARSAPSQ